MQGMIKGIVFFFSLVYFSDSFPICITELSLISS